MKHPFLAALAPAQAEALSLVARPVEFGPGETMFRQREVADGFYLIAGGEVALDYELPGKKKVQIQKIGKGELLGLSWLFEPYRWEFNATAVNDVTADFFPATDVRQQCERDPGLGYKVMDAVARVLTERLQATRHKLRVYVGRASEDDDARQVG